MGAFCSRRAMHLEPVEVADVWFVGHVSRIIWYEIDVDWKMDALVQHFCKSEGLDPLLTRFRTCGKPLSFACGAELREYIPAQCPAGNQIIITVVGLCPTCRKAFQNFRDRNDASVQDFTDPRDIALHLNMLQRGVVDSFGCPRCAPAFETGAASYHSTGRWRRRNKRSQ